MKTKTILSSLMLATFLLSGAQAFAAEERQTAEQQQVESNQAEQPRIEVCFDHPGQFKTRRPESGFVRPGRFYDSRPAKYESRL